jgi:hypothetical protein
VTLLRAVERTEARLEAEVPVEKPADGEITPLKKSGIKDGHEVYIVTYPPPSRTNPVK